jgi:hypothetical protein
VDDTKVGDKVPAEIESPESLESLEMVTVFEFEVVAGSNAVVLARKEMLPLGTVPAQSIFTWVELMRVKVLQEDIPAGRVRVKSPIATEDLNPIPFKVKLGFVAPRVKLEVDEMTGSPTVTLTRKKLSLVPEDVFILPNKASPFLMASLVGLNSEVESKTDLVAVDV